MKPERIKFCLIFTAFITFFIGCSPQTTGPQRIIENGIEVVVNGSSINPDGGRIHGMTLREEFCIDLEDTAMAEAGLTDVSTLDFDSRGRLYVFKRGANAGPVVFRFDKTGNFSKSFMTTGQGPGEVGNPQFLSINSRDEIPINNDYSASLQYFDSEGRLLRSIRIPSDLRYFNPKGLALLRNDGLLIRYFQVDRNLKIKKIRVGIFDAQFKKIKDLAEYEMSEDVQTPFPAFPITASSNNSIFIGSFDPGNEISVFDLHGELKRKIRLDYPTAPIPPEFKESLFAALPRGRPWRASLKFPATFPHYQELIADEEDRLYTESFEKDRVSGANLCDVFSSDGVRIARAAFGFQDFARLATNSDRLEVVIRNGRLACVREKENGFKEIIVYSMIWF